MHPLDHQSRALWHLELLGCLRRCRRAGSHLELSRWSGYDDDEYDDELACTRCGGEGFAEVDDPLWDECDEFGWGPCNACRGTGERRHQWVF